MISVFTHSTRDDSPVHVVSPEQFNAAEQRHEHERVVAKQEKEKAPAKDSEALRVSMDQLREVLCHLLMKEVNLRTSNLSFKKRGRAKNLV